MRTTLFALTALACLAAAASAGPNAGGSIICHEPSGIGSMGDLPPSLCGYGDPLPACAMADTRIDGNLPAVWKVYAAFPAGSSPRLAGVAFGVGYSEADLAVVASGACAEFEIPGPGWPGDGTGTLLVFQETQLLTLVELYWFVGYNYSGEPQEFSLAPHPEQGGYFGDDSIPAILDAIAGYGSMGFDMDGDLPCEEPPVGACCFEAECFILSAPDCVDNGGVFVGGECDPNPCAPSATVPTTWGRIKAESR